MRSSNILTKRLWKLELQKLANEFGFPSRVCHLPPGTSKCNKIEHKLFSFITGNWRGKPLVSHKVIVQLIGATTSKTGLKVRCGLDPNSYPKGIKVTASPSNPISAPWNNRRPCPARAVRLAEEPEIQLNPISETRPGRVISPQLCPEAKPIYAITPDSGMSQLCLWCAKYSCCIRIDFTLNFVTCRRFTPFYAPLAFRATRMQAITLAVARRISRFVMQPKHALLNVI